MWCENTHDVNCISLTVCITIDLFLYFYIFFFLISSPIVDNVLESSASTTTTNHHPTILLLHVPTTHWPLSVSHMHANYDTLKIALICMHCSDWSSPDGCLALIGHLWWLSCSDWSSMMAGITTNRKGYNIRYSYGKANS